jgi:hypothetical protein
MISNSNRVVAVVVVAGIVIIVDAACVAGTTRNR